MKTADTFFARVHAVSAALERTCRLMARYLARYTAEGWPFGWDFNLLHELESRLQRRLAKAWAAYYDWHFATCGKDRGQ